MTYHRNLNTSPMRTVSREIWRAKREGRWHPQPCERCGTTRNVVGHHEDYTRPLDITWLCRSHHQIRHAEINLERHGCKKPPGWQTLMKRVTQQAAA